MPCFLPFYHLVSDEPAPHVLPIYPVRNTQQFIEDLDWICRYFEPLGLEDLKTGKVRKKPVFHLSFDDGLRQCYDTIAPILHKKGIPASFFINPDFIENQALMFRYKAALLAGANPALRDQVLSVNYQQRAVLDQLAHENQVDFDAFLRNYKPYLDFEQLCALQKMGFSIGAHSMDHPYFSALTLPEQCTQARESIQWVRQNLKIDKPAFAFPFTDFGTPNAFFKQLPAGTLSFGSAGVKKELQEGHFQRFAMEKTSKNAAEIIPKAYFFYLAKRWIGKHITRR